MKRQSRGTTNSKTIVTALSVSPNSGDHLSLQRIFDSSNWVLYKADCVASALALLYRHDIGLVLCEHDLRLNTWVEMLEPLTALRNAPPLIVTSRLADDRLWAEALNLGAYDVLATPLDPQEVVRVVQSAWRHWEQSHRVVSSGKREQLKIAAAG